MNKQILLSYIKKHLPLIFLLIVFSLIFTFIFYLYSFPVEAVLYAALLCAVLGIFVLVINFSSYRKKVLALQELQNRITFDTRSMPEPSDAVEEQFEQLISIMSEELSKNELEAKEARSELMDYYTMWAHQIKVPLSALKLLIDSSEDSNMKSELFKIEQYVDMVLGYLRMESMSGDLLLKYYPLDSIVKQAVRKYSTLFIHKKIQLELKEIDCDVLTDEKWLVFVIEQILSNALKYTKDGGLISIYMDPHMPKHLLIEDNGIGIAKEDLRRVFQRGFTGYNGREYKKSTGIGLYLCERIMTKLSHTIFIESEVGSGTVVRLNLSNSDVLIQD